jgi:hypothetical protein
MTFRSDSARHGPPSLPASMNSRARALLPAAVAILSFLQGCRTDAAPPTSPMAPSASSALSSAALSAASSDASWDQVDMDVVDTTTMQPARGRGDAHTHTRRMHVERGHGADGRWYTRYTFPPGGNGATSAMEVAHRPDVAEMFSSDDRTEVRMTLRNGQIVRPMDGSQPGPGGFDPTTALTPDLRTKLDRVRQDLARTTPPARTPHWVDATLVSVAGRAQTNKRLRDIAGAPVIDSRGRPTYRSQTGSQRVFVALDPESGDIAELESTDETRGTIRMYVEHTRLADSRVARSHIRYEITRGGDAPSIVSDMALSNHHVTGGRK